MGDKKINFSVTCSLLSQYLKQKGNLGDLCLEIPHQLSKGCLGKPRPPTTMSLLPGVDVSKDDGSEDCAEPIDSPKSMDLFPQHTGFGSVAASEAKHEQTSDKSSAAIEDQSKVKAEQLTIFYGGKVLVFDNIPADKADDLFRMASKEIVSNLPQNDGFKVPPPPVPKAEAPTKPVTVSPLTSSSQSAVVASENTFPKSANASDMPIARRNSLHRFLEKRKDRISTTAPYQVHGGSSAGKSKDGPSGLN